MQSVTNIFIVNLAMADMLVMLFCAPPSVIWDVTNTWFFGSLMCKIVIYIQVFILMHMIYWLLNCVQVQSGNSLENICARLGRKLCVG